MLHNTMNIKLFSLQFQTQFTSGLILFPHKHSTNTMHCDTSVCKMTAQLLSLRTVF